MAVSDTQPARSPIDTVRDVDRCWREGDFDTLGSHFHDNAILLHASHPNRVVGRDAMVKSYIDFTQAVNIKRYEADGHAAHEVDDQAIVDYAWAMAWTDTHSGSEHSATGREYLTLRRYANGWRVMTRLQVED